MFVCILLWEVYKNIFEEQKYAEVYTASDAEREMNISRNSFVALAMLLGGDYTDGVKGVGIVNAMEVLDAFDVSTDLKDGLMKFRTWLDGFDPLIDGCTPKKKVPDENEKGEGDDTTTPTINDNEKLFYSKHRSARTRWVPPPSFPSDTVLKAYVDPVVDKSSEKFTWGVPDFDNILSYCSKNIGWNPDETTKYLAPVMFQLASFSKGGLRQTRIDSFMKYEDSIKFASIRSKRIRDVLKKNQEKNSAKKTRSKAKSVKTMSTDL